MATPAINSLNAQPLTLVDSAYRGPCPILGAHVTRVTHKGSTRILCSEYCEADRICRLKKAAVETGTLQALLGASSDGVLVSGIYCIMLTA